MEPKDKIEATLKAMDAVILGGELHLYVTRRSINEAGMANFSIIINDLDETELYREDLKQKIANVPIGDVWWWNNDVIFIPVKLDGSFFIYVIDHSNSTKFKFQYVAK